MAPPRPTRPSAAVAVDAISSRRVVPIDVPEHWEQPPTELERRLAACKRVKHAAPKSPPTGAWLFVQPTKREGEAHHKLRPEQLRWYLQLVMRQR